ncbi:hypothetical protein M438DRAFT_45381 [Aureobasidium pullulans EXF-150]|uniref:Secreted protein n=2 Tax=Aureobasidium pullulans TaxID=5580 RepID=A0A074XBD3_AURPU|nr:uncharacterized protein M438DRAFT_45381 [Aureobasidium pullulans EXF-150]KEQ82648.1 hypothetical protein M438DRAFT_45381 [Aureobasidium pullulans EXF-150]
MVSPYCSKPMHSRTITLLYLTWSLWLSSACEQAEKARNFAPMWLRSTRQTKVNMGLTAAMFDWAGSLRWWLCKHLADAPASVNHFGCRACTEGCRFDNAKPWATSSEGTQQLPTRNSAGHKPGCRFLSFKITYEESQCLGAQI